MDTDLYQNAPLTTSIDASNYTYNDPTPGLLDLQGLGEIILPENQPVTHYNIKGFSEGNHIFSIAIAEAPNSELYISDIWVAEDYQRQGIGTELVKITDKMATDKVYLYASTAAMRSLMDDLKWREFHEEWYRSNS